MQRVVERGTSAALLPPEKLAYLRPPKGGLTRASARDFDDGAARWTLRVFPSLPSRVLSIRAYIRVSSRRCFSAIEIVRCKGGRDYRKAERFVLLVPTYRDYELRSLGYGAMQMVRI